MARAFPDLENAAGLTAARSHDLERGPAAMAYRALTGEWPEAASIDEESAFDRHVLACIVAVAATETNDLATSTGLTDHELDLISCNVFASRAPPSTGARASAHIDLDEMEILRDLLLANRSSDGDCGRWLATMLARRALEPNHLWEDLGLRERSELTRLIARHFAPLALRNDKNMRWKRFLYRMMCEDDGFVMCASPVCSNCADYALCFGTETGTSQMLAKDGNSTTTTV